MTSAVNNYQYSGSINPTLSSTLKKMQENPDNFKLYMAQLGNYNINSLLSSAVSDENNSEQSSGSGYPFFNSLESSSSSLQSSSGVSNIGSFDPLSLFTSGTSATDDFSSLLASPSLDSYKVSETISALKEYSDITETKRWLGQMVSYIDPADKAMKTGLVSKVIIENVDKPLFIIDGKQLTVDDLVSIELDSQAV